MRLLTSRSKTSSEFGFTIVELIVTMLVGIVLVGSVNTIYTNQLYLSQRTRDTVLVNAFVEAKVEALRSQGFLSVPLGTTNITSELPVELSTSRSATLSVTTFSSSIKQIEITVSYNEQGTTRSYSYITYLGELGVGQ